MTERLFLFIVIVLWLITLIVTDDELRELTLVRDTLILENVTLKFNAIKCEDNRNDYMYSVREAGLQK